jgi:hypothetical protein
MTDYKKLYAKTYGITWDADMEIHHIDRNRQNNDISNLILLPGYLHHELHNFLHEAVFMSEQGTTGDLIERMMERVFNYGNSYDQQVFLRLSYVLSECKRWGFLKSVSYKFTDGSPIGHITKDTMKWIG